MLAFEPEQENFRALQEMVRRYGHDGHVLARRALLADDDTTLCLELNADNPADHHIGASGVPTPANRLDTVMHELGWPPVGLIKIDVQGAECMVLEGARQTLQRSRPAMLVEVDDRALRRFGATAEGLRRWLLDAGYLMYSAVDQGGLAPVDRARAEALVRRLGYADFVFLPRPSAAPR